MDKKGFTLVEMIAVIVLISIVAFMAIPAMTSFLKKGEEDKYKVFLNDVFIATEAYIQKNADDYPTLNVVGANTYIYMSELVNGRFLSSNLVNPKYCVNDECQAKKIATCDASNNCVVDNYTIIVTKDESGKYSYELVIGIVSNNNEETPSTPVETCEYNVGDVVFDKGYTGKVETFTPSCSGNYKIEAWGAQGGDGLSKAGGYGSYSTGVISFTKDTPYYVVVGGKGTTADSVSTFAGGYNGGGTGTKTTRDDCYNAGGGGATHIATASGLLSALSSNQSSIIMVAGGGGGSAYYSSTDYGIGGSAGGYIGNDGTHSMSNYASRIGTGGTQSTGAGFGQGGSGTSYYDGGAGGGGGWYGGNYSMTEAGAGGGSGYIGNNSLSEKSMYCYGCSEDLTNDGTKTISTIGKNITNCSNGYSSTAVSQCAKAGDGRARITYLGT